MAEKMPQIVELYRNLAGLMMEERPNALVKLTGPFPIKYLVGPNAVLLESNDHKIVKLVTKQDLAAHVMKFLALNANDMEGYQWTAKQVKEFVEYFTLLAPIVPMPQSWGWKSEQRYAFHKLPWDADETGPTPHWDDVFERTTNAAALRAWIGSLFDPESDRQQYIWLHGAGQNSKGTMIKFFDRVFGDSFASRFVPNKDSPFWTYGLLGKRLVAFPDTNNAGWVASGKFKSLTGDDPIEVEKKGEMSFTARLECKFIFASQEKPRLSSEFADMRRVILCEMRALNGDANTRFIDKLWAEGGAFLSKCIAEYRAMCPTKGRIQTDTSGLVDWIEDVESHFASMLERDFYRVAEGAGAEDLLEPLRLARYLAYHLKTDYERTDFRKYMQRQGIDKISVKVGGTVHKRYSNVQLRDKVAWK